MYGNDRFIWIPRTREKTNQNNSSRHRASLMVGNYVVQGFDENPNRCQMDSSLQVKSNLNGTIDLLIDLSRPAMESYKIEQYHLVPGSESIAWSLVLIQSTTKSEAPISGPKP